MPNQSEISVTVKISLYTCTGYFVIMGERGEDLGAHSTSRYDSAVMFEGVSLALEVQRVSLKN